jgi:hypothetical protein
MKTCSIKIRRRKAWGKKTLIITAKKRKEGGNTGKKNIKSRTSNKINYINYDK